MSVQAVLGAHKGKTGVGVGVSQCVRLGRPLEKDRLGYQAGVCSAGGRKFLGTLEQRSNLEKLEFLARVT